jgi:tetratricopeptide (TPR) repeat protein
MKMRQFILILMAMTTAIGLSAQTQNLDFAQVKKFEQVLDDLMEIIDTTALKSKLPIVESEFAQAPTELRKARLGILYHETALNLSFLSQTTYKGYAKKSFELLSELYSDPKTTPELLPFVASYRASALALTGAETKKIGLLGDAFECFAEAIDKYANVSYLPEFLRGSVAENLPWFFVSKRSAARHDFQSILAKQQQNPEYANWKIMSFTYWAWANQRQAKRFRSTAIAYLDKAIALDPNGEAGREKAEALKAKWAK